MTATQPIPPQAQTLVSRVKNLPPVSQAALKLVNLLDQPDADNDDIVHADTALTIPLNPQFSSLNVAQAAVVCLYEIFLAACAGPALQAAVAAAGGTDPQHTVHA